MDYSHCWIAIVLQILCMDLEISSKATVFNIDRMKIIELLEVILEGR